MKSLLPLIIAMILSACQVLRPPDVPGTLQADNVAIVAEATELAQTREAGAGQVLATAQAAETYVAWEESINAALVATVRAGDPPTIARNVGSAPEAIGTPAPGQTIYLDIGTAASINESDGCALSPQNQFPADIQELYVTARALNIRAGTSLAVEWRYEGQIVWQESWTVSVDSENFCLWFNLDPSVATLAPGNWSATLYADGISVGVPAPFSIIDDAMGGSG